MVATRASRKASEPSPDISPDGRTQRTACAEESAKHNRLCGTAATFKAPTRTSSKSPTPTTSDNGSSSSCYSSSSSSKLTAAQRMQALDASCAVYDYTAMQVRCAYCRTVTSLDHRNGGYGLSNLKRHLEKMHKPWDVVMGPQRELSIPLLRMSRPIAGEKALKLRDTSDRVRYGAGKAALEAQIDADKQPMYIPQWLREYVEKDAAERELHMLADTASARPHLPVTSPASHLISCAP